MKARDVDSCLILTPTERETLERWARRAKSAQAVAQRARLILGCAAGKTNTVVAHELRLTKQTVGKWRTRFLRRRLDRLRDEPGPAPRGRSPMRRLSAC
jgi:DNA-binding CsgD family transcriptional regulator